MRCATTALKQIKDMFGTAAYQQQINRKPDKCKGENAGCVLDSVCEIRGCPFRGTGVAPNVCNGIKIMKMIEKYSYSFIRQLYIRQKQLNTQNNFKKKIGLHSLGVCSS